MRSFFDTNVLLYADDARYPEKQKRAVALLGEHGRDRTGAVSTQVLQEYFVVATGKMGTPAADAYEQVKFFAQLDMVVIDLDHILSAIDLHRLHQFSLWDALIVEAARRASCPVLLTEDLQHGQRINGVEIVNPFL